MSSGRLGPKGGQDGDILVVGVPWERAPKLKRVPIVLMLKINSDVIISDL